MPRNVIRSFSYQSDLQTDRTNMFPLLFTFFIVWVSFTVLSQKNKKKLFIYATSWSPAHSSFHQLILFLNLDCRIDKNKFFYALGKGFHIQYLNWRGNRTHLWYRKFSIMKTDTAKKFNKKKQLSKRKRREKETDGSTSQ